MALAVSLPVIRKNHVGDSLKAVSVVETTQDRECPCDPQKLGPRVSQRVSHAATGSSRYS